MDNGKITTKKRARGEELTSSLLFSIKSCMQGRHLVFVPVSSFGIEAVEMDEQWKQTALTDCLLRLLRREISGIPELASKISIHEPGSFILQRSCMVFVCNGRSSPNPSPLGENVHESAASTSEGTPTTVRVVVDSPCIDEISEHFEKLINAWVSSFRATLPDEGVGAEGMLRPCVAALADRRQLRAFVAANNAVAFVANGSILARNSGSSDAPLDASKSVPFSSPSSLEREVPLFSGRTIKGMLIPRGVSIVTGGGFHGKSTLLRALMLGAYDKCDGDGREFVVTADARSISIRAEDGRSVKSVNLSPFISNIPKAAAIDPESFTTSCASGSTSQAAAVMEGIEMGCSLFLLDEDMSASNFMIRDSRLRSLITNEPLTPYSYRVNSLFKELGISSIIVIGGSGDWFDVQDCTVQLDEYQCRDVTKRVLQISKTFCTGRVEFNGRGLVHQLPWPLDDLEPRLIDPKCFGSVSTVDASEDGGWLYYGKFSVDLTKIDQRVIEGRAGALGIGVAFLWIATCMKDEPVAMSALLTEYDRRATQEAWSLLPAAKFQTYIMPTAPILAAAINRFRGLTICC